MKRLKKVLLAISLLLIIFLISCSITGNATKSGKMKIRSLPPNVDIYVDNAYKGMTPITISGLASGNHLVNFSKNERKISYSQYIKVRPGKTTSVHFKF